MQRRRLSLWRSVRSQQDGGADAQADEFRKQDDGSWLIHRHAPSPCHLPDPWLSLHKTGLCLRRQTIGDWNAGRDSPAMNETAEQREANDAIRDFNKGLAQTLILDAKL